MEGYPPLSHPRRCSLQYVSVFPCKCRSAMAHKTPLRASLSNCGQLHMVTYTGPLLKQQTSRGAKKGHSFCAMQFHNAVSGCAMPCCVMLSCRRPMLEGHHLVLGVLTSVLFTAALTNIIKCPVGRFRPDFNARCVWGKKLYLPSREEYNVCLILKCTEGVSPSAAARSESEPTLLSAAPAAAVAPAVAECDRKCASLLHDCNPELPLASVSCCCLPQVLARWQDHVAEGGRVGGLPAVHRSCRQRG